MQALTMMLSVAVNVIYYCYSGDLHRPQEELKQKGFSLMRLDKIPTWLSSCWIGTLMRIVTF